MFSRSMGLVIALLLVGCVACSKTSEGTQQDASVVGPSGGPVDGGVPSGWKEVDQSVSYPLGVPMMLFAQDGGCPDGWGPTWVTPGCEDLTARYCKCTDPKKCDSSTFACLELKCACSGSIVSGCKVFRAPFGPAGIQLPDGGYPSVGDSCDPFDAGTN